MIITVAGEKKEFQDGLTVEELIWLEKVENPQYVTVSVNENFIDQGDFAGLILQDGDEVEFLYFMGGGSRKEEIRGIYE
ncbi:MAG: sulfur carrier protein ThiS [Blautia sp.]|nr:sulfur carrier protein ThiS [Blautia sp.]